MNEIHFGRLVFENAKKYGDRCAVKFRNQSTGTWDGISWNVLAGSVKATALALLNYGLKEHEKLAIFAQNMHEIVEVDYACHAVKGVSVPMYATSSAEQIEYIINDAQISIIFVGEQYQFDESVKVLENGNQYLKCIVTIDPSIDNHNRPEAITFSDFVKAGADNAEAPAELERRQQSLSDDDLAILIYTSGTTGEPKGVMLSHANCEEAVRIHGIRLPILSDMSQTSISFLPFSHIFERGWFYLCLYNGIVVYINQNPKEILKSLKEVHPNMMCAVPRFWEKVYSGVQDKIDSFPAPVQALMRHAIKVGEKYNIGYRMPGKNAPLLLRLRYKFYEKTLFNILRKAVGLDRGTFFPCAGSQMSERVNIFMHSVGINLVVGYGLTETFATVSCYSQYNRCYNLKSVGDVMPDLQVKIGENNEILVKGRTITKGYYNKPEANKESFTEDGFFRTGDAGSVIVDKDRTQLIMIERIKELFKTSNAKYIAPQQIENLLEGDKYVEQSAIIADSRKYVTALIVPAYDALETYAKEQGIVYNDMSDLLKNEQIIKFFTERIAETQKGLAAYEQVKYFTLLEQPFSPDNDELTLTLKLKRKVINAHYAKEIELMYQH
jgi:long-chain acyl-CoA synthetase